MLTTGQALYGLMQATQEWFSKFSYTISQHGFLASSYGLVLFLRCSDFGITILLRTGYCFLLGDSSISWRSRNKLSQLTLAPRQNIVHLQTLPSTVTIQDVGVDYFAMTQSTVTIQMLFKLPIMTSSMCVQRTLRLNITSFTIIWVDSTIYATQTMT